VVVNDIELVACHAYVVTVDVLQAIMENRSSHRCTKDRKNRRCPECRCDGRLSRDGKSVVVRPGSTGKDCKAAIVLVADIDSRQPGLNVNCSCPCSRPRSTNKDSRSEVVLVVDIVIDDEDRNVHCNCPCSRPWSADKDRRAAVVLVIDVIVDDQDCGTQNRNVNCSCPCSRPGSTGKDRRLAVVDVIVDD